MDNIFIYTEIYNCGKIGKICLDSFKKYHPDTKVNVFGTPADFKWIEYNDNFIFHDISSELNIINGFNQGHLGTASLWAKLIKERSEKYIIHFDSDVIFRKECLSDLYSGINDGFDLVGPIRNYKHNPNFRDDVRYLPDVVQTLFFAFNREKISDYDINTLICMCRGTCNPLGNPIIDFFDPVSFDIIKNGGTVKLLNSVEYGGCDEFGKRDTNGYPEINKHIDFGTKLIHFSAVGSGMNFFNNFSKINVPSGYIDYAIDKYFLFCKIFYNEIHGNIEKKTQYSALHEIKEWY